MRFRRTLLIAAAAAGLAGTPRDADAWTQPKARLALHVQPHVTSKVIRTCRPAEEGGAAPTHLPCTRLEPWGQTKTAYDVYVVAARADSIPGIAGVEFGVDYDARAGEGLDLIGWTGCGDVQVDGTGPHGAWPSAGSGAMIIWLIPDHCRRRAVPGFEGENVHAVVGAFYAFAYGEDVLHVTADRTRGADPRFVVADCSGRMTELQEAAMPRASFRDASKDGACNPCLEPCALEPVCVIEPDALDFGEVPLGEVRQGSVKFVNLGPGRLRGLVQTPFSLEFFATAGNSAFELEPGETREVTVLFRPIARGERGSTLYTANLCRDVPLRGTGVRDPDSGGDVVVDVRPGDPRRRLRFLLPMGGDVTADVFDARGRRARSIDFGARPAGPQALEWTDPDLPAGVYFLRVRAESFEGTARLIMLP